MTAWNETTLGKAAFPWPNFAYFHCARKLSFISYPVQHAELLGIARQQQQSVADEKPANGGLFANAKISADALKKLTEETEDEG